MIKFKLGEVDGCENEPSTSAFKLDIIQNVEEISLLSCHYSLINTRMCKSFLSIFPCAEKDTWEQESVQLKQRYKFPNIPKYPGLEERSQGVQRAAIRREPPSSARIVPPV